MSVIPTKRQMHLAAYLAVLEHVFTVDMVEVAHLNTDWCHHFDTYSTVIVNQWK